MIFQENGEFQANIIEYQQIDVEVLRMQTRIFTLET